MVGGDIVFCSAGYGVGAGAVKITKEGDRFKATEIWRKSNQLINHWSSSVYHNGHLYGLFGFKQWEKVPLQCVELATGEVKWSNNVALANGRIYARSTKEGVCLDVSRSTAAK